MWEDGNYEGSGYVDVVAGGPYDIDGWNGDNEISSIDNASDEMESFIARSFC
ncbi:hypothetical protein [Streptomyces sp. NPDC001652]|uniref:hypothetical protein n=1 Tax=Streptomyces sp. NPDC001652 TaxID=3154393 RepID=UPI003332EBD2